MFTSCGDLGGRVGISTNMQDVTCGMGLLMALKCICLGYTTILFPAIFELGLSKISF